MTEVYPEISLHEEHNRQSRISAERFAARLNMSADEYIATLPQFPERPDIYDELELTVPLIVENRIPWMEAAGLSHGEGQDGIYISKWLREKEKQGNVEELRKDSFDISKHPVMTVWIQNDDMFNERQWEERKKLQKDATYIEHCRRGRIPVANALVNMRPDIVRLTVRSLAVFWLITGNVVKPWGSEIYLHQWDNQQPGLAADVDYKVLSPCRLLLFGSKIETLSLTV